MRSTGRFAFRLVEPQRWLLVRSYRHSSRVLPILRTHSVGNLHIRKATAGLPMYSSITSFSTIPSLSSIVPSPSSSSSTVSDKLDDNGTTTTGNSSSSSTPSSKPVFLQLPYTVACIGAPLNWGQTHQGTDQAPSLLRRSGLISTITTVETSFGAPWIVKDEGDLPFHTLTTTEAEPKLVVSSSSSSSSLSTSSHRDQLRNTNLVGKANEVLYRKVYEKAKEGKFVLTLGGDHSIALGSIAGLLRTNGSALRIIWVDAHADINLPETSPSGNIHGMPLAFLFKYIDVQHHYGTTNTSPSSSSSSSSTAAIFTDYQWLKDIPSLQPSQLVYIGLRDLDKGEKRIIKEKQLRAYTMYDIDKYGIGKIMEMTFDYLYGRPSSSLPLHISFDIDAIDPLITPATGTRVPGGLSLREAHYICEASAETGNLVSMDCVEVNPLLSSNPTSTVDTAIQLIGSALGKRIL